MKLINRFLVLFNNKKCDALFMELDGCIAGRRGRSLGQNAMLSVWGKYNS
jgi:hypothetical protein